MKSDNISTVGNPGLDCLLQERDNEQVYFGVTVSKQRAEFLGRMLEVPLCELCGRESAECEADPCQGARYALGEIANCNGCYQPFDPHHLNEAMYCPDCAKKPDGLAWG